jgi:cytochrome P450 family 110
MSNAAPQKFVSIGAWKLWLFFSDPAGTSKQLRKDYGDYAPLHFLGQDYLLILSPAGVRDMFDVDPADQDAFYKESQTAMIGQGAIWVLTGEKHRRARQLFSNAIQASHFREYGQVIQNITRFHVEKWQPGQTVRAIETTRAIALDVIMRLVFGLEDEVSRREGRRVLEVLWSALHPLIVLFAGLQRPWFPLWRRYIRARSGMYDWMNRLIASGRALGGSGDNVLSSVLAARDEQGEPMSDEDIRHALHNLLIAGHETTGTALAWALYELGQHPAERKRLREEITALGCDPDPLLVAKLPYLTAFCNETLRLHSPAPELGRVLIKSMEIGCHKVEAGTSMVVLIPGIHQDPQIYPEPDRFIPERFMERTYTEFEFLPFGGSYRRCLGAGIAQYEMRIALAEIATHWDFVPTVIEQDVRHDVAMGPKYGVPLHIKGRRSPSAALEPVEFAMEIATEKAG